MTTQGRLRRADHADAPALSRLGAATFVETFGTLYAPEDLQAFLEDHHALAYYEEFMGDAEAAGWVVEAADGALIGYVTAGPCGLPVKDMPAHSGELYRLYLSASAQGQGLGKTLLETALDWLEDHFEHVYLGVFSENFRAQKLYRRYGFEKVGDYDFMVGNHADHEWIMKKTAPRA